MYCWFLVCLLYKHDKGASALNTSSFGPNPDCSMHMSAAMPMPDLMHNKIHACTSLVHRTSHWWFLAKAMLGHMLGLQNAQKLFLTDLPNLCVWVNLSSSKSRLICRAISIWTFFCPLGNSTWLRTQRPYWSSYHAAWTLRRLQQKLALCQVSHRSPLPFTRCQFGMWFASILICWAFPEFIQHASAQIAM